MNTCNAAAPLSVHTASANSGASAMPSFAIDQMLGIADMRRILSLGNTAIYEGVKSGALPAPYRVLGRRVAWKASEIQAYLDSLQRVSAVAVSSAESA